MDHNQQLTELKGIMKRRKWWLVVPFVGALLAALAIALILPNVYRSSATILIQNSQIPSALVPSTITSFADQRIQSITQEVTSRSRILHLVQKYNLLPKERSKLTTDDLVDRIRSRIAVAPIDAEIKTDARHTPTMLTIAFTLSYDDESPQKAQLVTNELTSYYLEKNLEATQKDARSTSHFLHEQVRQARLKTNDLESKLAAYSAKHLEELPEFATLNMQKLEKLDSDVSNLNLQLRSLEEQSAATRNNMVLIDPYGSANDRILSTSDRLQQAKLEQAALLAKYSQAYPLVREKDQEIALLQGKDHAPAQLRQVRDTLHTLQLQLANLKTRYSTEHPAVQRKLREIAKTKAELKSLQQQSSKARTHRAEQPTNPAYVALRTDLQRTEVSIKSVKAEKLRKEAKIKELYNKLHAMPEVSKKYNQLRTDYQSAKANYTQLQQKLLAAQLAQGMQEERLGESFQVIEPAFLPQRPARPNRLAIILIGMALGLSLSIGLASLREHNDDRIYNVDVLQTLSGLEVFSVIPTITTKAEKFRLKRGRILWLTGSVCGLLLVLVTVQFCVTDLYMVYAKLVRLIETKLLI